MKFYAKEIVLTNNEICSFDNCSLSNVRNNNEFIKLKLENNCVRQTTNGSLLNNLKTSKDEILSLKIKLETFEEIFSTYQQQANR